MPNHSSRNFIFITLAVLALGIGLPLHQKSRIAHVRNGLISRVTYPESKPQHHVFGDLAAVVDIFHMDLTGPGKPEKLVAGAVTTNFFPTIGVEPVMGRAFLGGDDSRGHDHVVILSHRLWRNRFKGAPGAVGRSITLEGEPYEMVGVLPDFTWNNRETDVWVPCASESEADAGSYISEAGFEMEI